MNGSGSDNILEKMIYLCMDHLMHNPKRAVILLLAFFLITMITGELIGAVREADPVPVPTAAVVVQFDPAGYFELMDISDNGAVNLTPAIEMTETPAPEPAAKPAETESSPEIRASACSSESAAAAGNSASVDYPGGYPAVINVRYRPEDPGIVTGTVSSGDMVYLLDGPVCLDGVRWWKINSDKYKIIGWIPETISDKPVLDFR